MGPNGATVAASSDIDMTAAAAAAAAATDSAARTDTTATAGDEAMPDAPPSSQQQQDGTSGASPPQQEKTDVPPQPQSTQPQSTQPQQPQQPPPPAGPRASRLQDLFQSSLHHTLAKISWPNFAACYPTAAARNPVTLQAVHRAMVDRLRELCAAEFAVVLRNRDVVRRLNELEVLAADARKRREEGVAGVELPPVPPHTLPPETVLTAHLRPQRRAQRQLLEERLAGVQAENAAKFARLAAQQAEAEQLVAALERALADAARAAALLDGNDGNDGADGADGADGGGEKKTPRGTKKSVPLLTELARETRAAEAEMRGSA